MANRRSEYAHFHNCLRQCLGLSPLYELPREQVPTCLLVLLGPHIGDGNRHVVARPQLDELVTRIDYAQAERNRYLRLDVSNLRASPSERAWTMRSLVFQSPKRCK